MQAILRFPDCVDTSNVKKYSYAAANGGRCPTGQKRMPSLRFSVRYDTRKAIPKGWSGVPPFKLACGEVRCLELNVTSQSGRTDIAGRSVKDIVSMVTSSTAGTKMRL